jgi:hypothetical protein
MESVQLPDDGEVSLAGTVASQLLARGSLFEEPARIKKAETKRIGVEWCLLGFQKIEISA